MAAARNGDRPHARTLLADVAEQAPDDPLVWLWRAGLAEMPETALIWIHRALELQPDFGPGRAAANVVCLQAASSLAQQGDLVMARELIIKAAKSNPAALSLWSELDRANLDQVAGETKLTWDAAGPLPVWLDGTDLPDSPMAPSALSTGDNPDVRTAMLAFSGNIEEMFADPLATELYDDKRLPSPTDTTDIPLNDDGLTSINDLVRLVEAAAEAPATKAPMPDASEAVAPSNELASPASKLGRPAPPPCPERHCLVVKVAERLWGVPLAYVRQVTRAAMPTHRGLEEQRREIDLVPLLEGCPRKAPPRRRVAVEVRGTSWIFIVDDVLGPRPRWSGHL